MEGKIKAVRFFKIGTIVLVLTLAFLFGKSVSYLTAPFSGNEGGGKSFAKSGEKTRLISMATPDISKSPSFVEIVESKKPSVVNISTTSSIKKQMRGRREQGHRQFGGKDPFKDFFDRFYEDIPEHRLPKRSLGSGFIVSEDGYIITNNHVVEKSDEIKVTFDDDKEYDAKLIGTDSKTDLALIKITVGRKLPFLEFGDSDTLKVGEWVLAIGNPFGYEQSVTAGIVSGKGRVIGQGPYDDFIQTDASINPGNSGRPLLNSHGDVVGINTAIFTAGGRGNIGIGFAIPVNMAKSIIEDLKERGTVTRGWLGVMIQKVTPEIAKSFGIKKSSGALIGDVLKKSPAEKAGVKRGDIIVKFDGKGIRSVEDLPKVVALTRPGAKVKMGLIRDGKKRTLDVVIGTLKESGGGSETISEDLIGISVQNINDADKTKLDLKSKEGVLVVWVDSQGPAYLAGIRNGQVIIEVNRTDVKTKKDYDKAVSKLGKGDVVTMVIKDGRGTRYAGFTIPE
ncbi:MAG: DegQ family serine endoprotease [Nitrospinota bacterium]